MNVSVKSAEIIFSFSVTLVKFTLISGVHLFDEILYKLNALSCKA